MSNNIRSDARLLRGWIDRAIRSDARLLRELSEIRLPRELSLLSVLRGIAALATNRYRVDRVVTHTI